MPGHVSADNFLIMKKISLVLIAFLSAVLLVTPLYASEAAHEFKRLAAEVAALNLGFEKYNLGSKLTEQQKLFADNNRINKSLDGTYKFKDGDVFVVAKADDDTVLGIYKEYNGIARDQVRAIVGDLMMRFNEPTTIGHDKLIYWAFDKNGRIPDDVYSMLKKSSGADVLGLVKFSSTLPITGEKEEETEEVENKAEEKNSSVYVIVSSDPLSKLFLAMNR